MVFRRVQIKSTTPPLSFPPVPPPEKSMRRVWRKGMTKRTDPYWYVEAMSREGAINFIARQFRERAEVFDSTKD